LSENSDIENKKLSNKMETENTSKQSAEIPEENESKNNEGGSDHINPISLKYLREAWKQLKEEENPLTNELIAKRAAKNMLGSGATQKELNETEERMNTTLERAIVRKEEEKTQKPEGASVSTIAPPEEPPTEPWEDLPETIPTVSKEKPKQPVKDTGPRDWYTKWEWEKEKREDENRKNSGEQTPNEE
jgi:hypothetical protein